MKIELSQDELKLLVSILTQVQLSYGQSMVANPVIFKLESFIEKPKPVDVTKQQ